MIIEAIFELFYSLLEFVFGWITLPDFPSEVQLVIDEILTALTSAAGIVGIFIDWNMFLLLSPIVIAVMNLDKLWKATMFVLKKIPFLNIE